MLITIFNYLSHIFWLLFSFYSIGLLVILKKKKKKKTCIRLKYMNDHLGWNFYPRFGHFSLADTIEGVFIMNKSTANKPLGLFIPVVMVPAFNNWNAKIQTSNKPTTQQTRHANDLVNANSHTREKPLFAGQ